MATNILRRLPWFLKNKKLDLLPQIRGIVLTTFLLERLAKVVAW
jgi:hypothetical protein